MANRLSPANLVARSAAFARALAQRNPRLSPFRQREGGAMSAARFAPLTLLAALAVAAALFAIYVYPAYAQEDPAPDKPRGLEATASHGEVVLTWDDPNDDSITGYVILRRNRDTDAKGHFHELVSNTGTAATTYTDGSVTAATRYTYRIKAINQYGVSERSRWYHIDTLAAPEPETDPADLAPANLAAELADGQVVLSWNAPAEDAGTITGYEVLRAEGQGDLSTLAADTGSTDTIYTDATATTASVRYAYSVKAIRDGERSQASGEAVVQLPPAAPTEVLNAAGHDRVMLNWNDPQDGSITGYRILRAGVVDGVQGEFAALIQDTGNADTSYTDRAVEPETSYVYRVLAINPGGASEPSSDVEVRTNAPVGPLEPPTGAPAHDGSDHTVSFHAASYDAYEDGTAATVRVVLSPLTPLTSALVVPLTAMGQDGATANDWTAPANVTIPVGAVSETFDVSAGDASGVYDWDPGESVLLGFGELPTGFAAGTQATTTVVLHDDESVPIEFHLEVPASREISESGETELALVGRTVGNEAPTEGIYFTIRISEARGDGQTEGWDDNIANSNPGTGTFQLSASAFSQEGEIYVGRKIFRFTTVEESVTPAGLSIVDDEQAEDTEVFALRWSIKGRRDEDGVGDAYRYRYVGDRSFRMSLVEDDFRPAIFGHGADAEDISIDFDFPAAPGATEVATLEATDGDIEDAENGVLAWSIEGGADRGKFNLTAAGVLSFKTTPDPTKPSDADTDGVYEVTVEVTDGHNPVEADVSVRVVQPTVENFTARAVAPMQVTLEWDRLLPSPTDLDLEDPPGYRIEWSADGAAPWTSLVNISNQHVTDSDIWCACYPAKFNNDAITPGTTRYYRIQAVDEDGNASPWSTVVSATTPALVDSDGGLIRFGTVESQLDAVNDQKVFRITLPTGAESYRFRIAGSRNHRVTVTDADGKLWEAVLEPNNTLDERFTTRRAGVHEVKISHGGGNSNAGGGSPKAGPFHFTLLPVREPSVPEVTFGPGEGGRDIVLNTYGDVDRIGFRVQPGKAYQVQLFGRENAPGIPLTAATPRIKTAMPPSTNLTDYNMGKPWVEGITTTAASTLCHNFDEPEKCEYQAFVIDLRGLTGPQEVWYINITSTQRPGTRPYRLGTYRAWMDELSPNQLQGVRMPLRAWFASPPTQHDGSKRVKIQVTFSDAPENVGADGVSVEGGEVTSVRPVDSNAPGGGAGTRSVGGQDEGPEDREVVWELEIEPDSDEDVTVSLAAWRPCGEPGAICTADGRPLSQEISTTVPGPLPLTASFHDMPQTHEGESAFTFRVTFSEDIGISDQSLRENAFTVTGGTVTMGQRVDDRRDHFEVTVQPGSNGDVTITLPAGRDCGTPGAICTKGENQRQLTNSPTATVAGPPNTAAAGAPTISGTAQVGKTLTSDRSEIADEDGLSNADFSYQWLADEADIAGATGSTYALTDSEEGKAITVQVSFTDDVGNEETLTSGATEAVATAEPAEPPAKPRGLSASATHDSVTLTWDDPGDDAINGYVILRRNRDDDPKGHFDELVADTGTAAATYTDDTVAAGTSYTYRIKAINEHGVSERSRWSHIDTPAAP